MSLRLTTLTSELRAAVFVIAKPSVVWIADAVTADAPVSGKAGGTTAS
jgi:hypothetical protein